MQITLAHIGVPGRASLGKGGQEKDGQGKNGFDALVRRYLERASAYARCQAQAFRDQEAFLDWLARRAGRTAPVAVLLDSQGRAMHSESFAVWIGARRDEGAQHLIFAIGPANGWSDAARSRARLLLSLGPMTLAHALARLVLAEQIYRALTILAGHPYHCRH